MRLCLISQICRVSDTRREYMLLAKTHSDLPVFGAGGQVLAVRRETDTANVQVARSRCRLVEQDTGLEYSARLIGAARERPTTLYVRP